MLVVAFDRDWTVDVNPHPSREAVPLAWVRHLAHETEHAVYAIGNQTLAEEAAIPGVVDIVGMHPDAWADWLGGKRPDGRYERFPSRRERLALITDLHPDADGYLVVDDLDLSAVDGWDHYHAWEFVPAVERGDIDPALPWVREPVADGGSATVAGVMPADCDDLRAFLDDAGDRGFVRVEHDSGTAVVRTLAYRPSGPETHGLHVERFAGRRLDAPVGRLFRCHIDEIELVHVDRPGSRVDLLPGLAAALRDSDAPDAVVPGAMADIAAERPAAVAPHVDAVVPLLEADAVPVRRAAARCVSHVAGEDAAAVVDAVPALAARLADRETVQHAGYALSRVADVEPAAVQPVVSTLVAVLTDASVDEGHKTNVAAALGRVVAEDPAVVADRVDALAALLAADTPTLRANGVGLLGDVARVHTDCVAPHVDAIAGVFPTDDDHMRVNASAALSRVAQDFPATVAAHTDLFVDLLADDHHVVRTNACWALGYLEASAATDALEAARDDDHEDVRLRAQWALAQIERAGP